MLAWILATIVYQIGSRIQSGVMSFADLLIIIAILIVVISIIAKKKTEHECCNCPYSKSCNKN